MKPRIIPTLLAVPLILLSSPAAAWCKHKGEREAIQPAAGVTTVEVFARAGELRIRGRSGATEVQARGEACADREDMLEVMGITMLELPDRLQVLVEMPDISGETDPKWKDKLAVMDLWVDLPDSVNLIVHDSSGGLEISQVASLELTDSSGDIELRNVGAVTIQVDSAGEIYVDAADSVTIATDTSGDIRLYRIQGDVIVGTDSSGAIVVEDVGGKFIVENDTSGDIRYRGVAGTVSVPETRQGG